MDCDRIYKEIIIQRENYYSMYNIEPNEIIIGIELLKIIENDLINNINGFIGFGDKTIMGMNVTEDYRNKTIIKVGYMEKTFV